MKSETVKSESGFLKWLIRRDAGMTKKADRTEQFRTYLYNSVIEHVDNKTSKWISASNKSTNDKSLTIDMLSKSIFACFVYREPVEDNMTTELYKRQVEVENVIAMMNMLNDLGLHAWNPDAAAGDTLQRRLARMFRSKSIMSWSELLVDAVTATLKLHDSDEKARPFYRDLSKVQLGDVKSVVSRLFGWKFWADGSDEIDRILSDNKSDVKQWFKEHGLTPGYLMGASM